jgi:hypothetical protein
LHRVAYVTERDPDPKWVATTIGDSEMVQGEMQEYNVGMCT